jgi:hypothetical protein
MKTLRVLLQIKLVCSFYKSSVIAWISIRIFVTEYQTIQTGNTDASSMFWVLVTIYLTIISAITIHLQEFRQHHRMSFHFFLFHHYIIHDWFFATIYVASVYTRYHCQHQNRNYRYCKKNWFILF